jgi:hypothetical protein
MTAEGWSPEAALFRVYMLASGPIASSIVRSNPIVQPSSQAASAISEPRAARAHLPGKPRMVLK